MDTSHIHSYPHYPFSSGPLKVDGIVQQFSGVVKSLWLTIVHMAVLCWLLADDDNLLREYTDLSTTHALCTSGYEYQNMCRVTSSGHSIMSSFQQKWIKLVKNGEWWQMLRFQMGEDTMDL